MLRWWLSTCTEDDPLELDLDDEQAELEREIDDEQQSLHRVGVVYKFGILGLKW